MNPRSLLVGVLLGLLVAAAGGWRPGRSAEAVDAPSGPPEPVQELPTEGAGIVPTAEPEPTSGPQSEPEPTASLAGDERAELERLRVWTDTREQELLTELDQAFSRYEQQLLANLPLTPEQVLEGLQAAPDLVHRILEPGGDPAGAAAVGELYWSPGRDQAVLVVEGLAVSPDLQLQVFAVDGKREDDAPVSLGLFHAEGAQRTVAVLEPALPLGSVAQVLVTAEAPGGRVVSLQERLVLASLR